MACASQPDSRNALILYTTTPTRLTSDPQYKNVIVMLHMLCFCNVPGLNSSRVMRRLFSKPVQHDTEKFLLPTGNNSNFLLP